MIAALRGIIEEFGNCCTFRVADRITLLNGVWSFNCNRESDIRFQCNCNYVLDVFVQKCHSNYCCEAAVR
jgi:hypothetical protein